MREWKMIYFLPSAWLLVSAGVEACFQKWIAVQVLLAASAAFAVIGLIGRLLDRRTEKERRDENWKVPFWIEWLWNGEWIRTKDPKKKSWLLYLSRLTPFFAFFVFGIWKLFSGDGIRGLESGLLILAWALVSLVFLAQEVLRTVPTRAEIAASSPEEAANDKRFRQIETWQEAGLIDRQESLRLKEEAEKGANRE